MLILQLPRSHKKSRTLDNVISQGSFQLYVHIILMFATSILPINTLNLIVNSFNM